MTHFSDPILTYFWTADLAALNDLIDSTEQHIADLRPNLGRIGNPAAASYRDRVAEINTCTERLVDFYLARLAIIGDDSPTEIPAAEMVDDPFRGFGE